MEMKAVDLDAKYLDNIYLSEVYDVIKSLNHFERKNDITPYHTSMFSSTIQGFYLN